MEYFAYKGNTIHLIFLPFNGLFSIRCIISIMPRWIIFTSIKACSVIFCSIYSILNTTKKFSTYWTLL